MESREGARATAVLYYCAAAPLMVRRGGHGSIEERMAAVISIQRVYRRKLKESITPAVTEAKITGIM